MPSTDPAQIAANCQGILTPEQTEVLVRGKYAGTRVFGFLLLIFSVIFFLCLSTNVHSLLGPQLFSLIFLGCGCVLIWQGFAKRNHFREGIATGQIVLSVEKQEGEIIWNQMQKAYSANLPRDVSRSLGKFLPGPYVFYFVREERQLISLEPTHTSAQKQQALLTIQQALSDTLGFDLSDLDANRQGLLTERQRPLVWFRKPTVQFLDGKIFGETKSSSENSEYYYHIQGTKFQVPNAAALRALVSQVRYRVYYLEGT